MSRQDEFRGQNEETAAARLERRVAERTAQLEAAGLRKDELIHREQAARSDLETARGRMAFLAEASRILSRSLDLQTTLDSVVSLVVPALADWCIVDLVEGDHEITQRAGKHSDPGKSELVRELRKLYPPSPDEPHALWRVIRSGRPELATISDQDLIARSRTPEHTEMLRALGIASHMVVPMVARGRVLGAISFVSGTSGRRYGELDLALAQDLAARCALATDNARLHGQAGEAIRSVTVQYVVNRALAEAETLAEAAPRILQAVCETLDWAVGAIWVLDRRTNVLRSVEVWQAPQSRTVEFDLTTRSLTFERGAGLPGYVWDTGGPIWIADLAQEKDFVRAPVAAMEGLHGWFGFPIRLGEEFLGVMEFFSPEVRQPDEDLLGMMTAIGSQLGQFIQRRQAEQAVREREAEIARLLEEEQAARVRAERSASRTAVLQTVTAALAEAVTPSEVAYLVVERSMVALGAQAGSTVVLTEDGSALELVHASGYPEHVLAEWTRFPADASVPVAESVRTGLPVFIEDRSELLSRYPDLPGAFSEGGGSFAAIPLAVKGRTIGAMGLSFPAPRSFSEEEAAFMVALGRQSAQAIERARLYEAERTARAEAEAAQQRLAFLAEASDVLSSSLDYRETLAQIARVAVPRLADWISVDVLESDGAIHQLAVAHSDEGKVELAREFRRRNPLDPQAPLGIPRVIRSMQPELYEEITDDLLARLSVTPAARELVRELRLRSVMIVPLRGRSGAVGALTFVWAESGGRFGSEDLALALELARRGGQAIENARLYEERDHIARTLQQNLLPPRLPEVPGLEIAARYRPAGRGAEVGGDFYDMFETSEGSWAAVIGDVCGKGPNAAAVTGLARYTIRAAAMREARPSGVLSILNDALLHHELREQFCTVCYVRLRPSGGTMRLTICAGGHPLPIILRADGSVEKAGVPGTLLGVFRQPELRDRVVELAPGDAMVLYTDGVTEEREGGNVFGDQRLTELIAQCRGEPVDAIVERIERAVVSFQPQGPRDDIALLALRVSPG